MIPIQDKKPSYCVLWIESALQFHVVLEGSFMKNHALFKPVASALAACILLLPLSACSGQAEAGRTQSQGTAAAEANTDETVLLTSDYAPSEEYFQALKYGDTSELYDAVHLDGSLYAISEGDETASIVQLDGENLTELYQAPSDSYLLWLAGNGDTLAFVQSTFVGETEQLSLYTMGTDGSDLKKLSVESDMLESIGGLAMDRSKNLYLLSGSNVELFDCTGQPIGTFACAGQPSDLVCSDDGAVYISSYLGENTCVVQIDPSTIDDAAQTYTFSGTQWRILDGFQDWSFLLYDGDQLLGYNGQSLTELVNWSASSIHPAALSAFWENAQGVRCYLDENRLYQLASADAAQVPETTTLSMGVWNNSNAESAIGYYQQQHPEVTVGFQRYSLSDGMTELNLELAAGAAPDLFDLAGMNYTSYANKRALLDLTSQLNAEGLSTDDFISADILKTGDSLYVIPSGFSISTWKGLTSVFGDQVGWTWEAYMEMQESLADGQYMTPVTPEDFLSSSIYSLLRECIDYSAASCDFSPLEDVLKAARDCTFTGEFYDSDLVDGTVRLIGADISSIGDHTSLVEDGAYTLIGLPSQDGSCTAYFSYDSLLGINAASANIDAAWELIRYVVCDYPLEDTVVLPCISAYRPIVDQEIAERLDPESKYAGLTVTGSGEDGYTIDGVYYEPGIISMTPTMTQAEADSFWDFVNGISLYYAYDSEISSIVQEESAAYLSGDKSAEAVISLIESRTSIYLSEQQ
jgi:multiple sugar transport system substrate-binding protein